MSKQVQIRRSAAQWRALFGAHDVSGLPAAVFCRQHAPCPKYFSLRRRQFGWRSVAMPTPKVCRELQTSLIVSEKHRSWLASSLRFQDLTRQS